MRRSADLFARLAEHLPEAEEGSSTFGERPALFVDGKEIAHLDEDGTVDIRLTRGEIRARRGALKAGPARRPR
jgi:hypothetical protein